MTTPEQFRTYLASPEGRRVECKAAIRSFHFEELGEVLRGTGK